MEILSVKDSAFAQYGRVVDEFDFAELLETLREVSPKPADDTIYVASDPDLEGLDIAKQLRDHLYGGMPIQLGYCNGSNHTLNCLEYHRGAELNVADDDVVLLLAPLQKIANGKIDTGEVQAFKIPAGTAVLLYETTLHYAPCAGGFRVVIVLPAGTNTDMPVINRQSPEDELLWGRNKWLLAHPDSPEAEVGAWVGLTGPNLTV